MRTETKYFAFDDTEFDTEEECLEYERMLSHSLESVVFYDEECQKIVEPTLEQIEGYGMYMAIVGDDSDEILRLFQWLREMCSFDPPEFGVKKGDVLRWDEHGDWVDMRKEASEILERADKMWGQA